ncbi:MAG: hypothetical protein ACI8ZB_004498, partial [Desulforhopalus sp.]
KEVFDQGRDYKWSHPSHCPRCFHYKVWGHGFVDRIFDDFTTPDGAKASADIYSLIETAKANNLEPYKYLRFFFEKIPFVECEEDLRDLLPMNLKPEQLVMPEFPTGV